MSLKFYYEQQRIKEAELNAFNYSANSQIITEPERRFVSRLITFLLNNKTKCRVLHNPIYYTDGRILRPDFSIEQYGIVIEIDGPYHDRSERQMNIDLKRCQHYMNLGFKYQFTLSNADVYSEKALSILFRQLREIISEPATREE